MGNHLDGQHADAVGTSVDPTFHDDSHGFRSVRRIRPRATRQPLLSKSGPIEAWNDT